MYDDCIITRWCGRASEGCNDYISDDFISNDFISDDFISYDCISDDYIGAPVMISDDYIGAPVIIKSVIFPAMYALVQAMSESVMTVPVMTKSAKTVSVMTISVTPDGRQDISADHISDT